MQHNIIKYITINKQEGDDYQLAIRVELCGISIRL